MRQATGPGVKNCIELESLLNESTATIDINNRTNDVGEWEKPGESLKTRALA